MLGRSLARTWEIDFFNEGHPVAFDQWWLRDLDTVAALARASRARCALFKPILETARAAELLARFPAARLLFAVRHFQPVVRSGLALFGEQGWPGRVARWVRDDSAEFHKAPPPDATRRRVRELWRPELDAPSATALYWLFYTSLYLDLHLDSDPRVRLVCYEAVLADREGELGAICHFLGVRPRRSMSAGIRERSAPREPLALAPDVHAACEALYARVVRGSPTATGML